MIQSMSVEQNSELENVLTGLLVKAEASSVFLCDRGGNILAQQATQGYRSEDNIAALASGSFYATRVLAQMLGESEFRHVIHQGQDTSMFMQMLDSDMMLLVVFGRESNPGLVKLYCNEVCHEIDRLITRAQNAPADASTVNQTFELDATRMPFGRIKT